MVGGIVVIVTVVETMQTLVFIRPTNPFVKLDSLDITCGTVGCDDYGRELKSNKHSPKSMTTGTGKALYCASAAYPIVGLMPLP